MEYTDPNRVDIVEKPDPDACRTGSIPQVFELVERLARKLKGIQRQTVSAAGLTPPQYVVLGALAERDRRPLKELADAALCSPATITGIVDVLERRGLVRRQPNPEDRRSLLVALTEEGRVLQTSTPSLDEMLHGCCTGLRPDEATQLTVLLQRLDESLLAWEVTR